MLGIAKAEWALQERVKELTCLYGIARAAQEPNHTLEQRLQNIVGLLPPAWQFAEITSARIILDGKEYATVGFVRTTLCQSAELIIEGARRGSVEVVYSRQMEQTSESPFLPEEQSLIEMVAREVSIVIERHETEVQKAKLEEQLRHADRLATLGQLAAGVAHELNEPLANILGFAQLAKKAPHVPKQAGEDLEKIVRNCLHAREIIQRLLTFGRQMPPEKTRLSLNHIVTEQLTFMEARCRKAGVEIVRTLADDLPEVNADASQIHQVLVNLVVNAVQAMQGGGTLTIETRASEESVSLIVRDTGTGMTEATKRNIFTPFFTTKDVSEGTGLGLPVVHGIVISHGGKISVESEPGRGTMFEVKLPRNHAATKDASE
jgi:two-component system NtrC family sensor kinase